MKRIVFIIMLSMFLASAFAQGWDQAPPTPLKATTPKSDNNVWNVQISIDLSSQSWSHNVYGIATDNSYLYVSKWNANKFYQLTTSGALVDSFNLSGNSLPPLEGIRDLTYDGQYFYGGVNTNIIYKMDFNAQTLVDSITLPLWFEVRYISYDPTANGGAGGLWVGPWNSQGPRLYSMNGTLLDSIPAINLGNYAASGCAFDNVSPGGPYLWLYSQATGGNLNDLIQVNISTKQLTGVVHDVSTEFPSIAGVASGGLFLTTNLISGTSTLAGLTQGGTIWGYDLASSYLPQNGMTINSLTIPAYIQVNTPQTITGVLKNAGLSSITSFNLNYTVNGGNTITQNISGVNIISDNTYTYTDSNIWTPSTVGSFTVNIWASDINGDSTFTSDTLSRIINTMTVLTMRNVVLEEYTGIHAMYGPAADKIANDYKALHPDNVFLINIYQGGYAVPDTGEPDFRTIYGDSLANQTGLTVYPAGTVNRHLFGSNTITALGRNFWTTDGDVILAMPTYATVSATASVLNTTRVLTVNVNVNYTSNGPALNMLNVALLQDSIEGPQEGDSLWNPTQIATDGKYLHMHVLRNLLTGQWGDTITTTTSGTNFQKTYTYTLPANINNVDLDINHLNVIAFIAEGTQEIATGTETPVSVIESIHELSSTNNISLYPNPAKDKITLDLQNITDLGNTTLSVYSIDGKLLHKQSVSKAITQLNINELSEGLYVVMINNNNSFIVTKFVKE